mmetsp:Transcript_39706/g.61974  ORF Transcript_39706/g.61974 Transcript_39706/m.61974 type:complete len:446 (-) Transcript_39706:49-1386(-)
MSGGMNGAGKKRQSGGGAASARLAGEAQEYLKKRNDGIWARPVAEEDLLKWESLVLGPALSPYAFGFFSFRIQFAEDYPSSAPLVTFLTTNGGKTRFNPNLYSDGKVCLSILGTWRGESGEQWSSVQNCHSIMVSIQSLMDDMPYHNEPGFEKETLLENAGKRSTNAQALEETKRNYNLKITHETMRIAVCDVLQETFSPESENPSCFADIVKYHFLLYYDRYIEIVQQHADVEGSFVVVEFEYPRNSMNGEYDFKTLKGRLAKIREQIDEETKSWVQQGEITSAKGSSSYDCQQVDMALQKFKKLDPPGISVEKRDQNMFVWDVTIHGGLEGCWWDGGLYFLEIVFPPDFPDNQPRPKFRTKMFHPNITADGFPFVSVSVIDCKNAGTVITDILSLLIDPPNPDPRTWVNKEAADLYFNGGDQGREEYSRKVRRLARRSIEDME